ncbi:hypothetical protein K470DRAFT_235826 [Piedraia hortae CBS 480.64]|uniref:Integral membrane protein TmpA n=1 Tax=Piedraia hortae CBS 480.64 TaxID=1314780 RepID=A0A6A7BTR2_9PEZI|nr:hypothetical protein K470DRAFT_235826 [Piedraia hortae CBS 480.64]
MPAAKGPEWYLHQRFHVWTVYRRLMAVVISANASVISAMIVRTVSHPGTFSYDKAATAAGANILVSVLMRHEHIINNLFRLALLQPRWFPLVVRRSVAKIAFHYGGIHSSAGIGAIGWYIFYLVLVVRDFDGTVAEKAAMLSLIASVTVLLLCIAVSSHPYLRNRYHNSWELLHRFGGWTAVGAFWAQIIISSIVAGRHKGQNVGLMLIETPTFWFLSTITCCIIYPWLYLRKIPLETIPLSNHATELKFTDRQMTTCRGIRLSHNPLKETHAFASIPGTSETENGYSVIVSNAGDWTRAMIQNPPSHIWRRGAPTIGVMRLTSTLSPVVVVTTGSGIGPCLSFLNCFPDHNMRVLWSARTPMETFPGMIDRVHRADNNAIIIDTRRTPKPDFVGLTYALLKESHAEGVVVISNPHVTKDVVKAMEMRGITAFGAIFDS